MKIDTLIDRGIVPDFALRAGIRRQLRRRLRDEGQRDQRLTAYADALRALPVAERTDAANEQHYEVPAAFFEHVLGSYLKYSCGYWPEGVCTLAEAEEAALALTASRAGIQDGMTVLDLGCGWGSMTRYIARNFPKCRVLAVSNSHSQRAFIEAALQRDGSPNAEVLTADARTLELDRTFDRIVSIEMFEHMANWEALLARMAGWLSPDGRVFIHVFVHKTHAYRFEDAEAGSWMGRHFFTGGQMPADDLLLQFDRDLGVEERWRVGGQHYAKTARAWLDNVDAHRDSLEAVLDGVEPGVSGAAMLNRWRVFFMACEELWAFRHGTEWFVSHYRLAR